MRCNSWPIDLLVFHWAGMYFMGVEKRVVYWACILTIDSKIEKSPAKLWLGGGVDSHLVHTFHLVNPILFEVFEACLFSG